jgi:hypothetical protein
MGEEDYDDRRALLSKESGWLGRCYISNIYLFIHRYFDLNRIKID